MLETALFVSLLFCKEFRDSISLYLRKMLMCFKTINLPYGPSKYHIFIASFVKRELLGRCCGNYTNKVGRDAMVFPFRVYVLGKYVLYLYIKGPMLARLQPLQTRMLFSIYINRVLDSLVVECWLRVRKVPGSIKDRVIPKTL